MSEYRGFDNKAVNSSAFKSTFEQRFPGTGITGFSSSYTEKGFSHTYVDFYYFYHSEIPWINSFIARKSSNDTDYTLYQNAGAKWAIPGGANQPPTPEKHPYLESQ